MFAVVMQLLKVVYIPGTCIVISDIPAAPAGLHKAPYHRGPPAVLQRQHSHLSHSTNLCQCKLDKFNWNIWIVGFIFLFLFLYCYLHYIVNT